jgi:hypothetical protein
MKTYLQTDNQTLQEYSKLLAILADATKAALANPTSENNALFMQALNDVTELEERKSLSMYNFSEVRAATAEDTNKGDNPYPTPSSARKKERGIAGNSARSRHGTQGKTCKEILARAFPLHFEHGSIAPGRWERPAKATHITFVPVRKGKSAFIRSRKTTDK